ncbi:hypothetical protein HYZ05_00800 [Candidatus Daviesbacteria bacterium]|nr:hypothetical protein [Candidatus Daviesbacteria bacterium]
MAKNKSINSVHFPYIPVKITVSENSYGLEALIDTGFNGQVILPPSLMTNGQLPKRFVTCKLADNSMVEMSANRGSIKLGGKKFKDVLVIIMGDEPVIGREVIKHFKIILDHGRKIILER